MSGKTLKVLRLTDFYGAMTGLTKIVARECKLLETLCLERCNLTVPIADILNQTATIKEVRLQKRVQRYGRRRHFPRESQMKRSLLERIQCNTVTKLALLDRLNVGDVDIIARAFPNVTHFEIMDPSAPLLSKFLAKYPSMECVRLVEISTLCSELISVVQGHGQVKSIQLQSSHRNMHMYLSLSMFRILPMRSITITCDLNMLNGLRLIAEYSNVSLEVLKLDGYYVSTTAADLTALSLHCPNLRVLHLRVLTELASYASVFERCATLEELWFGDCISTSVEQVASSIVANCQHLETVAFNNNANNQKFTSLLRTCPKLHNIGFARWSNHYSTYADRPKHDSAEFQF